MDAVAGLLDGPRARGAFLLRSTLEPPWCLRIEDEAPLTLMSVVKGEAYVGEIQLKAGDVAIARGPDPYTVADDPSAGRHPARADLRAPRRAGAQAHGLPRHAQLGQPGRGRDRPAHRDLRVRGRGQLTLAQGAAAADRPAAALPARPAPGRRDH